MNPMTNIKNLQKLNERELELGIIGKKSWHDEYKDSAWIFVGGLPYELSEGDIICVFSQYGEIVNINLVRDSKTGKSKGYAFICFQDQRTTVLSVDNLNGIKILGRTIRVDHVKDYKMPKERGDEDELTLKLRQDGCAPRIESSPEKEETPLEDKATKKKRKKEKKKKAKKEKKSKKEKASSEDDDNSSATGSDNNEEEEKHSSLLDMKKERLDIKEEKFDKGYDKALNQHPAKREGNGYGSPYDGRRGRQKDWVKEEKWYDREGDRRKRDLGGGSGRDEAFRDSTGSSGKYRDSDSRPEIRSKRTDDREFEERSRWRKGEEDKFDKEYNHSNRDRERNSSYKNGRNRNDSDDDDFRERHNGGGSGARRRYDDKDGFRSHSDRDGGGGVRRKGRSSSRDRNRRKSHKHRSRSRSRSSER